MQTADLKKLILRSQLLYVRLEETFINDETEKNKGRDAPVIIQTYGLHEKAAKGACEEFKVPDLWLVVYLLNAYSWNDIQEWAKG